MRRFVVLCAALLLWAAPPARASTTYTGTIAAAAVAPEAPKRLYNALGPSTNGLVGYVYALPAGSDGGPYTLTRTSGIGNPDVWFYTDDGGKPGTICSVDASEDGLYVTSTTETGTICPGDAVGKWALVVLFTGAGVGFSLTV